MGRVDVAVAEDGDFDTRVVLDAGDEAPVGLALVELGAGAAVHREGGNAHILQALSHFFYVFGTLVPAQAGFYGHGQVGVAHHGGGHGHHLGNVLEQGRARAAHRHLLHRAAVVDVNQIGPRLGADSRALTPGVHVGTE